MNLPGYGTVSTSSAAAEEGTRWGRAFLARSAGAVPRAAASSISSQRVPRTSPLREAVRTTNRKAGLVLARCRSPAPGQARGRPRRGERSVVLHLVAITGQCTHHRGGWVVRAVAFGDDPRHDGPDATLKVSCGLTACLPDRRYGGEQSSEVTSVTDM